MNPHRYENPDDAARDLKRGWVVLRRRIFKRYGERNLPFLAVFERTKNGWPHLHILIRAKWISQKWLSDQMADLIGAPIVDIRKIDDEGRAAAYVSKYVGKDPHVFEGCKRWWRSHNYDLGDAEPRAKIAFGIRWDTIDRSFDEYVADVVALGGEIIKQRPGFAHFRRRRWREMHDA